MYYDYDYKIVLISFDKVIHTNIIVGQGVVLCNKFSRLPLYMRDNQKNKNYPSQIRCVSILPLLHTRE